MNLKDILENLKERGFRITKSRKFILNQLFNAQKPLSPFDLLNNIGKEENFYPNKTTIYRELNFLEKQKIIKEIHLETEKEKRYEIENETHHHHVVCRGCDKIEDVEIGNELEKKILGKVKNFASLDHSLEFYGMCNSCR